MSKVKRGSERDGGRVMRLNPVGETRFGLRAGHCQPKNAQALKSATAVSVGVYVSQEDDWERAGIDPSAVVRPIDKSK
jgi:hypothetical protein